MVWNFKSKNSFPTTENCTRVIAEGNFLVWLLIFLVFTFSFAFGQLKDIFIYDDKGKRDPFLPLVNENGQYLLEVGLLYSFDELKLSGILWDPQGRSSALINNQIVKIGETICGFVLKNIAKDSVTISKDGKDYIIRLSVSEDISYGAEE